MLNSIITDLISKKSEGDYWDFKLKHHEKKFDLLFDIICLANSPSRRDKYIIFGIDPQSYDIIGANSSRTQADIIDLLHSANFAENAAPEIELDTLSINNISIDVLTIKNSLQRPYYLTKNYLGGKTPITKGTIFSREKDRNTAIDSIAPPHIIKQLWMERFGLLDSPIEKILIILPNATKWHWDGINSAYYENDPDYTITIQNNTNLGASNYWWGKSLFEKPLVVEYALNYKNKPLKKIPVVFFQNENIEVPFPEVKTIKWKGPSYYYDIFYYNENSLEFSLLQHIYSIHNKKLRTPIESLTKPPIFQLPFLTLKDKNEISLLIQWTEKNWGTISWKDDISIPIEKRNKEFSWWVLNNYPNQKF